MSPSPSEPSPRWANRAWTGVTSHLSQALASADEPAFQRLSLALLRLWATPAGAPLDEIWFEPASGGYLGRAGEPPFPLFVHLLTFPEPPESLGEPQVDRCREAIRRFEESPLKAERYLLIHNNEPRNPAFRLPLESEIQRLIASGRVANAEAWGRQKLLPEAHGALTGHTLAALRTGALSLRTLREGLRQTSRDLLETVPLQVSRLEADQYRLRTVGDPRDPETGDPSAIILESSESNLCLLLGGFGFGKTTTVLRALRGGNAEVLFAAGASMSNEIVAAKDFLVRCVDTDKLFSGCSQEDVRIYMQMLRPVVDYLFKDGELPLVLVIDGLDESAYLCRSGGLQQLFNSLSAVRIPVILSMRTEFWLSRIQEFEMSAGKIASHARVRRIKKVELLEWSTDEILRFVQRFRSACADPDQRERLGQLEELVTSDRFATIYGDIPRRPLFLRLIAESVADQGLPAGQVGRAGLFREWARWKILRDVLNPREIGGGRPTLRRPEESTEEIVETVWEAMLYAAASMTEDYEGMVELTEGCAFDRLRTATPRLAEIGDVLALYLQSLLKPVEERTAGRPARVAFAHRAFQEFFLAWHVGERGLDDVLNLPEPVQAWISDLRQEGWIGSYVRDDRERPPGLPPSPIERLRRDRTIRSEDEPKTPGQQPRPDLELWVVERPGGGKKKFELILSARDPELDLVRRSFGFITFESDPARFFELHLKELKKTGPAAIGAYLTEKLLPRNLTRWLSSLRGKARTLQIRSDDPWIPWELLRIEESEESGDIDGPFLCEAFALTRWFHPVRKTTTWLPLSRIALIGAEARDLPQTAAECQDMLSLAREGERRVERIPALAEDIEQAMQSGEYDGWHFSGHGTFTTTAPDLAPLYLDRKQEFTPARLRGKARRMGVRRPLVFLNGCSTGQSGVSLSDVGGWAPAFLEAGAGAFLGALWPITDSLARRFARVFYERFLAGQTISEAVFEARQAIRSETDPTWLAYTVFAHPLARQRRGED